MEIDEAAETTAAHPLDCDISMTELNGFISRRKSNAIGLDLIHDMLLHLPPENRVLLYVLNLTWSNGFVPLHWRQAIVIPILKQQKTALPYLIVSTNFFNLLPWKTF